MRRVTTRLIPVAFAEGHAAEAVEDVVAALALARHVSRDGTLDGLWAGHEIERRMAETLALGEGWLF